MHDPEDREPEVGSDSGYEHTTGDRSDADDCDSSRDSTQVEGDSSSWTTIWE